MISAIKRAITPNRLLGVLLITAYFVFTSMYFGYTSPSMILVGLPCPGCGLTRAGLLMLRGNIAESFRMHPLFLPVMALVAGALVCKWLLPHKMRHIKTLAIILLVCSIILYVLRMRLLFPHTPPMTINSDSILHNMLNILREGTR